MDQACKNVFCYVKSPYWQEYVWKILVRFLRTPLKISKYINQTQYCWRECGECNVDLAHVLYTCSKIQPYWVSVLELMKQICGQNTNFEPLHAMLGIQPKGLNKENYYIFWVLRTTAIKQITRGWKKTDPPRLDKWIEAVEKHENEIITHKMRGKMKLFKMRWFAYANQMH